jgi:hypothetical protein
MGSKKLLTDFESESKVKFETFMSYGLREVYRVLNDDSACFIEAWDAILNKEP